MSGAVLITDHPWGDVDLEKNLLEAAGLELVAGPQAAEAPDAVAERVKAVNPVAIMTCWAEVKDNAIRLPDKLSIVARIGVGLDNIAVGSATARGAWVTNVPDYCISEVSDHAIALLLAHFRGIVRLDRAVKRIGWNSDPHGLERISDLTVGLVGYGRIGKETGRKLSAFGCRILAADPTFKESDGVAERASLTDVQEASDAIILHAPLVDATKNLVDVEFLSGCKKMPLLINVSRGGLVENGALIAALDTGDLRGAALDVVEGEPNPPNNLIFRQDIIATPHIAFSSRSSLAELRRRSCEEVIRVLSGKPPRHPCNEPENSNVGK